MNKYFGDNNCTRHIFMFTYSGKLIFSTYNSEHLVSLIGTLCAIGSKFENRSSLCPQPDKLRHIIWGDLSMTYFDRGPIHCVSVSKSDPPIASRRILELLHRQFVSILTRSIDRTLTKRPSYDLSQLMGGTNNILLESINRSTTTINGMVEGFQPLTIDPAYRNTIEAFVRVIQVPSIIASFMFASDRVVSMALGKGVIMSANDVTLISNMVMASKSLREMECWTPICLPSINENAFVHAYVNSLVDNIWLVYISAIGDTESFYSLSNQHLLIKQRITESGCINKVVEALKSPPLSLEHFGIIHAVMWLKTIGQFTIASQNLSEVLPLFKSIWHNLMHMETPTLLLLKMVNSIYCFFKDDISCLWLEISPEIDVTDTFIKGIQRYFTEHKDWFFIPKFPQII